MPVLYTLVQEIKTEGTLANSFYEASITQMPKPGKVIASKENWKPISLINIDTEILNEILANQIHQFAERRMHHN